MQRIGPEIVNHAAVIKVDRDKTFAFQILMNVIYRRERFYDFGGRQLSEA